jgi:anti-sigma B factor antagonist
MLEAVAALVSAARPAGTRAAARMPEDMQIADYALDGRTRIIEVEGQVDLYSAPEFKERTAHVISDGAACVIIDLSRVTFMDSTGLGVLVGALKRMRAARADLLLVVTGYDIERLFELAGLDGSFRIYRSRDDALEDLALNRGV